MRGEEARKCSRECELFLLVEEVEQGGCMDCGDLSPKLCERFDPSQIGRWCALSSVGGWGWLEEGRIECIPCYERDWK